ncbi:uncharacterized protein DUF115 [Neorhizobium sp. R1-B]|nr:uncharacterized protein DUF115 [Neorhizobium sp. S3-V5DH]TDX82535.1 uncharacterized protein DUF115 [Neorhizobium sp. R1-B]
MPSVTEFYKKYDGKRCFILGNGPSLNKVDMARMRNEFTFGVNSIFLMTRNNNFRPTFYVVEDNLVFSENKDDIDAYQGVIKILPQRYAEQLKSGDSCHIFEMDTSFYNRTDKANYGTPQFNIGSEPVFYCGQSVTYINMQLAYYFGFSEVYLIGMDFSYSKPSDHHQKGNHIRSEGDDPNHFHKDYFGKGKTWKDPRLGRVQRSYLRAKFEFEIAGRIIMNATSGGELETFSRIDLDTLWGN